MSDHLWKSRREAAELVGISPDVLDKRIRPLIQEGGMVGEGKRLRYCVPAVVAALVAEAKEQLRQSGDPLLDGDDSPALERYRAAKADLAELELATRRRDMVSRTEVLECLTMAHGGIRSLIERWERKHRESEARELRAAVQQGLKRLDIVIEAKSAR